jgi:hypothetical protein
LPATPALRREQIRLQVALITPVIHVNGYAAPDTKAAAEKARLLIQQAEALGETLEDQLLLFSALYGFWGANYVAFDDGDVVRKLAAEFIALAEKQDAPVPRLIGHRVMGISLFWTGEIVEARKHLDEGRKRRTKTAPVLGAAGLTFSLVAGTPAAVGSVTPPPTISALVGQPRMEEEQIPEVSLATFHVPDEDSVGPQLPTTRPTMVTQGE